MKAIKTDYNGVTYRSKTEAIFARCLDLAGVNHIYEPNFQGNEYYNNVLKYKPDFLIARNTFPYQSYALLEIKPSVPSKSYFENLNEKLRKLKPYNLLETATYIHGVRFDFYIVVFNPFEGMAAILKSSKGGGWINLPLNCSGKNTAAWVCDAIRQYQDAMEYRFDLEQNDTLSELDAVVNPAIEKLIARHENSWRKMDTELKDAQSEVERLKKMPVLDYLRTLNIAPRKWVAFDDFPAKDGESEIEYLNRVEKEMATNARA